MNEMITLIGGPGDGCLVPRDKPMFRPPPQSNYPFEILGHVDYIAEEIGFLWPVRLAEILDEEIAELYSFHEVSRHTYYAGDPFVRYCLVIPEDAIGYRIKFWTTWLRRRRVAQQMASITEVFMFLVIADDHPGLREYKDEIEYIARLELRALVKLLTPNE